jgi:5-methylcytosine-specific restriction endonuclease McrA
MNETQLKEKRRKHTEYMRKWRALNPDKIKAIEVKEERKEYLKSWRKRHYAEHAEQIKATTRAYYAEHKKEINKKYPKRWEKWRTKYPERAKESARIRTRKHEALKYSALGKGITLIQWKQICDEYINRCVYCGRKTKLEIDHIVPLSQGGFHDISNIVPACRSCNGSKNKKSLLMFLYDRL